MLEAKRVGLRGDPEVEAKAWLDKLAEVETTRAGYQQLAAKGLMTFEELAARLDELESTRQTAQRELAALEGKRDELRALEQDAAALLETYENTIPEQLDNLTPEERHHIYKLLQLRCLLRPDAPPELTGVFMANAPKVRKTGSPYTQMPPPSPGRDGDVGSERSDSPALSSWTSSASGPAGLLSPGLTLM
jgi:hypothetical protein